MTTTYENNALAGYQADKALTIFCGVIGYKSEHLRALREKTHPGFKDWNFHVNPDQKPKEELLNLLGDFYYESLVSSIFPGYKKTGKSYFNEHFAGQTLRCSREMNLRQTVTIRKMGESSEKEVCVDYLDLFFFPGNIAIYAFRCDFGACTYDEVTWLVNNIRSKAPAEFGFLRENLSWLNDGADEVPATLMFGNKLKSFTLVEMGQDLSPEEEKHLLFDLATCSPVGSASGAVPYFQPTGDYLDKLWDDNTIKVFDNWKGMCLFDSFTGLFRKGAFIRFVWENAYFNLIFLHSVFVKHYLFRINRKFFLEKTDKQELEDEFYEFDNYFNFRQISYNFLPQIIYERIRFGFDIEDEMAQLQSSIERANVAEQNYQERRINKILTVIAFLTVFSVLLDASELIDKLIFGSTLAYQMISGSMAIALLILISLILFRKRRNSRKL